MKRKTLLDCIFVVEGKSDGERLKKLNVPYLVRTEGLKVPRETIKHLQALAKIHTIVVLVDPDSPGEKIKEKLLEAVPALKVIKINKREAIKKGTVGVENVKLDTLQKYIAPYLIKEFTTTSDISYINLLDLGLSGRGSYDRKLKLVQKFNLLVAPLKNMYIQLQLLNINYNDIKEALSE